MKEWLDSAARFRIERILWTLATLAVVFVYFVLPKFWQQASILYLAIVSNYALVLSLAGAEQAAKAKEEVRSASS